MIRQYIGARYVPKFYDNPNGTSEWLPNVIYEPLTIVTYDSNSYTSKKTVPASVGIPANNPEYWVATGNYNAFIEDIQEDIGDINNSISDLSDTLDDVKEVTDLVGPAVYKKTGNRKFIFVGDSYGHGSGSNTGWIDRLIPKLGLSAADYYETAIGGAGFTTSTNDYLTLLTTLSASITNKSEITDIVVLGGANDKGYSPDEVKTFVDAFTSYCNTNYPNAIVSVGFIGGTNNSTYRDLQYARTIAGYSKVNGVFLNNLQYVLHDIDLMANDGVHPNSDGYTALTEHIYGALMGGTCVSEFYHDVPADSTVVTLPTGSTWTENRAIFEISFTNGITQISTMRKIDITFDPTVAVIYNTNIELAQINIPFILGGYWNSALANCTALVHSTTANKNFLIPGLLYVNTNSAGENALYFRSIDALTQSETSALNSCDRIIIDPISLTYAQCM